MSNQLEFTRLKTLKILSKRLIFSFPNWTQQSKKLIFISIFHNLDKFIPLKFEEMLKIFQMDMDMCNLRQKNRLTNY
jgi:hypothetical protein